MATSNKMDAAERLGFIKGLTGIVQSYTDSIKTTNTQIQQLAATVENLTKGQPTQSKPTLNSGLRLPNLVLPEFTGKEPSDRFLDHLHNLVISLNVPAQYLLTYLKQQCITDSRAYDALVSAEDVSKANDHDFKQHFEAYVNTLREKRGKPCDQQIRDLLSTYYDMHQHPQETVADFAHRFCEVQHELEKLIPKIHGDLEMIYAFVIKLREDISLELVSQEFNFKTLQSLIAVTLCYESHSDLGRGKVKLSTWQPTDANFIQPATKKPDFGTQGNPLQNLIMLVIFDIKLNQVNFVIFLVVLIHPEARVVVIKVNHKVEVTQQIRFAFILIVMSPQPVSCPIIYVVIVVSINA